MNLVVQLHTAHDVLDIPEQWRPIPGFPMYEASDQGRISSRHFGVRRYLRPVVSGNSKYGKLTLVNEGQRKFFTVHQAVALAFHGPRPDGMCIRHLNGDHTDNRPANLRYGGALENAADTRAHHRHGLGETNGKAILTAEQVIAARLAHRGGAPMNQVADEMGVKFPTMWAAITGVTWPHLPYAAGVKKRRIQTGI